MDPTGQEAFARWLAYGHPLWMLASLGTATLALRAGLRLRSARRRGARASRADGRRHTRLGKTAVALILGGYASGPLSMALLRGREPWGTAHAFAATLAALLFVTVAVLGRRLETRRGRPLQAHALLAVAASLVAAVAFATGFVMLP